jgi:hypothetical protein
MLGVVVNLVCFAEWRNPWKTKVFFLDEKKNFASMSV